MESIHGARHCGFGRGRIGLSLSIGQVALTGLGCVLCPPAPLTATVWPMQEVQLSLHQGKRKSFPRCARGPPQGLVVSSARQPLWQPSPWAPRYHSHSLVVDSRATTSQLPHLPSEVAVWSQRGRSRSAPCGGLAQHLHLAQAPETHGCYLRVMVAYCLPHFLLW
jgi:hypothetical protein